MHSYNAKKLKDGMHVSPLHAWILIIIIIIIANVYMQNHKFKWGSVLSALVASHLLKQTLKGNSIIVPVVTVVLFAIISTMRLHFVKMLE